ncbi:MAG TPA: TraM recognition domain-containing protein [Candidatus Dormibacteraeota bacterium]
MACRERHPPLPPPNSSAPPRGSAEASACAIPALANLITTGRSRAIHVIAAFQHYRQAEHLWGAEAAGLIFSGTTSLFFSDCGDREVTTRLSELSDRPRRAPGLEAGDRGCGRGASSSSRGWPWPVRQPAHRRPPGRHRRTELRGWREHPALVGA